MTIVSNFMDVIAVVTGAGQSVRDLLITTGCGDVNRACLIVPGEIAWDECDCGQLAQTITQTYPSNNFPVAATDQRQTPCGPQMLVITVQASIVRCVPIINDNGAPPTCVSLEDAAIQLECDRHVLRQGITCYLRELRNNYRIHDFTVGSATSIGPQGACAGVDLIYQFGISNTCC